MKPAICFLLAFGFILHAEQPGSKAASVPVLVVGKRTFLDAEVRKIDSFTVRITHADGAAKVPAWELSKTQQRKFGFEPAATAAKQRRVEEERMRAAQAAEDATRKKDEARKQEEERLARVEAERLEKVNAESLRYNENLRQQRGQAAREVEAYLRWRLDTAEAADRTKNPLMFSRSGPQVMRTTEEDRAILRRILPSLLYRRTQEEADDIVRHSLQIGGFPKGFFRFDFFEAPGAGDAVMATP